MDNNAPASAAEQAPGGRARPAAVWLCWAALLSAAAALRLAGITTTNLWHDEIMSIQTARMGVWEQLSQMSVANNQPPLFFLLLKIWALVSSSPLWLRLLPVSLSLIGVVYAVRWGRLFGSRSGWIAGLLVASCPLVVHYGQELRAYALLYTCMLAGLYFGEGFARQRQDVGATRWQGVALVVCSCIATYAHYTGPMIAAAIWVYAALRGASIKRVARLAVVWIIVCGPMVALGVYHAVQKADTGFWVAPVSPDGLLELATTWIGTHALGLWQSEGAGVTRDSVGLVLGNLLLLGIGLSVIVALSKPRRGSAACLAAGVTHFGLVVVFSLVAVPITIERTTLPAFIPIVGMMALACTDSRSRLAKGAAAACVAVALAWTFTCLARAYSPPERRPFEQALFEPIQALLQPGDLVVVFPQHMQDSAGYFLQYVARAEQIHSAYLNRLTDGPNGLKRLPVNRRENPDWLAQLEVTAWRLQSEFPGEQSLWVVDMATRSAADPDREALLDWLSAQGCQPQESYSVGSRWMWSARRFVMPYATVIPDELHQDTD